MKRYLLILALCLAFNYSYSQDSLKINHDLVAGKYLYKAGKNMSNAMVYGAIGATGFILGSLVARTDDPSAWLLYVPAGACSIIAFGNAVSIPGNLKKAGSTLKQKSVSYSGTSLRYTF